MKHLWLVPLLVLCFVTRLTRVQDVFTSRSDAHLTVASVDADCYTRMFRVKRLLETGRPVFWHDFENAPFGIRSHATVPLDYLIAGLALALQPLHKVDPSTGTPLTNAVDLAGALVSPLLGLLTLVYLWFWAGRYYNHRTQIWIALLFAVLPAVAWAYNIGRPDHQSLYLTCLIVALTQECNIWRWPQHRPSQIAGGVAWGLALWTSLFEPLALLAVLVACQLILRARTFLTQRPAWWASLGVVVFSAAAVEGLPLQPLPLAHYETLLRFWFHAGIGELKGISSFANLTLLFGLWPLAIPILLVFTFVQGRLDRRNLAIVAMLVVLVALATFQQSRAAHLFGTLICLFGAPLLLMMRGVVWQHALAAVLTCPLAIYYSEAARQSASDPDTSDILRLGRELAVRNPEHDPVMAPWWLSPALLHSSGAPIVASSSHQSISGIHDSCDFYLSTNWGYARKLLLDRGVRWVVVYDPGRTLSQSLRILGLAQFDENQAVRIKDFPFTVAGRLFRHKTPIPELSLRFIISDRFFLYEFVPRTISLTSQAQPPLPPPLAP